MELGGGSLTSLTLEGPYLAVGRFPRPTAFFLAFSGIKKKTCHILPLYLSVQLTPATMASTYKNITFEIRDKIGIIKVRMVL